jgi:hypothetical protein
MAYEGLTAPLPIGPEGLTGSKNLATVRPTQLLRARNITQENGTIQKEPGTTLYTGSAIDSGATIMGGWDWWPSEGVQRSIVLTSNGKLLKDAGAGTYPTTLASGLSVANVVPVFVEGGQEAGASNRKLFVFTGKNAVQVLSADGATTTAISLPPADWSGAGQPVTGLNHEGRLWGFKGHFGYYSTTTDHEDLQGSGSGTIAIYPGEGEAIVQSFVFGPYIVVVKRPAGIYLLDTTSPTIASWKVSRITRQIGGAGPLSYAVVDGDAIVVDVSGEFYALSSVSERSDVRPRSLTQEAFFSPFIRENTNPAQYGKIVGIYYPGKRQAWFAVAGAGSSVNNTRIKMDFSLPDLGRFGFGDFVTCEALWLTKDSNNVPRPWGGDNAGKVRRLDQMALSHDSSGYIGEFQTPYVTAQQITGAAELRGRRMLLDFLELVFEPKGDWDLSVDVLLDGELSQTLAFNMGGTSGAILGSTTTLDTDFYLGGDSVTSLRKRITGSARRISILGRNSGSGQDFSVAEAYLSFRPGDEVITR